MRVQLEEREHETIGQRGDRLRGRGYGLRDERGRALAWDDPCLAAGGLVVIKVVGVRYRAEALQDGAFTPGCAVILQTEPENPHDRHAVAVLDEAGRLHAGYVPRELAPEISRRVAEGGLAAFALWEWRDPAGQRCGLRILVGDRRVVDEIRPVR